MKQDGAELREACEPGDPVVAKLAAGTAATVRFGMNGCYAVEVSQSGQTITGFLPADALILNPAVQSCDAPSAAMFAPSPWISVHHPLGEPRRGCDAQ